MSGLLTSVRAEWLKLRTTMVPWVLAGIGLVISSLFTYFIFRQAAVGDLGDGGTLGGPLRPLHPYPYTVDQLRNLIGGGLAADALAMILGALIVTTEFRHKTVTNSLLAEPRRSVFVSGKFVAAALTGAAFGLLLALWGLLAGGLVLVIRGGSFGALAGQFTAVAPGMMLVFALYAMLGTAAGSIVTNQVGAIAILLGWSIVAQPIVTGIWPWLLKWLPDGLSAAIVSSTLTHQRADVVTRLLGPWTAAGLLLAYAAAIAAAGWGSLARRDMM